MLTLNIANTIMRNTLLAYTHTDTSHQPSYLPPQRDKKDERDGAREHAREAKSQTPTRSIHKQRRAIVGSTCRTRSPRVFPAVQVYIRCCIFGSDTNFSPLTFGTVVEPDLMPEPIRIFLHRLWISKKKEKFTFFSLAASACREGWFSFFMFCKFSSTNSLPYRDHSSVMHSSMST